MVTCFETGSLLSNNAEAVEMWLYFPIIAEHRKVEFCTIVNNQPHSIRTSHWIQLIFVTLVRISFSNYPHNGKNFIGAQICCPTNQNGRFRIIWSDWQIFFNVPKANKRVFSWRSDCNDQNLQVRKEFRRFFASAWLCPCSAIQLYGS